MKKFNQFFRQNLFYLVIASMTLGLLFGWLAPGMAKSLKVLIVPILFLMIYSMIIPMNFSELLNIKKYIKSTSWGLFTMTILAPLIAWGLSFLIPAQYSILKIGLILASLMPPGGMIISWTGLLDADVELAMILQTITFILSIITIPLGITLLLGTNAHFSQMLLLKNIALYIFLPLIAGYITQLGLRRIWTKERIQTLKPNLATLSGLCAITIIFIATSLKTHFILAHPAIFLWGLIFAFIYYFFTFLSTLFLTAFVIPEYEQQMPIVYGTTSKNLSIGIALALSVFHGPAILGIVFCYLVQMPFLSLIYKFIRKEEQELAELSFKGETTQRQPHPISSSLHRLRKTPEILFKQTVTEGKELEIITETLSLQGAKVFAVRVFGINGTNHDKDIAIILKAGPGYLVCSTFDFTVLNKKGFAAAKVVKIKSIKEALKAKVIDITEEAKRLGIKKGMAGEQALLLFAKAGQQK